MYKFLLTSFLLLPSLFYTLEVQAIQSNLTVYFHQFQTYKTHFTLETKGQFGNKVQKGTYSYRDGESTYQLANPGPVKLQMKKDGSVSVQSSGGDFNSILHSMESLYQLLLLKQFEFQITNESVSNAGIIGNETGGGKLIINYNKMIQMVDYVKFTGDKTLPAIESSVEYTNIRGVPILQNIYSAVMEGRIDVFLEHTEFDLK